MGKKVVIQDGIEYEVKVKVPFYKKWWFWLIVIIIGWSAVNGSQSASSTKIQKSPNKAQQQLKRESVGEDEDEDIRVDLGEVEGYEDSNDSDSGIPREHKSALASAESYSNMNMSKQGIYDQLTSEYGEKFSAEAAQYAVDNLKADYKNNALESAKSYQDSMNMSPESIRDQLVSEHGEQFTQEEADYAIDHLPK